MLCMPAASKTDLAGPGGGGGAERESRGGKSAQLIPVARLGRIVQRQCIAGRVGGECAAHTSAKVGKNSWDAVDDREDTLHSSRGLSDVRKGHLCVGYANGCKCNGEEDLHGSTSRTLASGKALQRMNVVNGMALLRRVFTNWNNDNTTSVALTFSITKRDDMIGTSDQSHWLAQACNSVFFPFKMQQI